MKRTLKIILYIIIVFILAYQLRNVFGIGSFPTIRALKSHIYTKYFPCKQPIPYALGSFSNEFNLSQEDFLATVAKAESVWEKPTGIDLFTYVPDDTDSTVLKINLIYDYREQATKNLADIGITVKNTKASYDSLKLKLGEIKKDYEKEKIAFDKKISAFNEKKDKYNKEIEYWNAKGGAPEAEYEKIQAMGAELKSEAKDLEKAEAHLNATIDEVNALIVSINGIAKTLNLSVEKYNTISVSRGESFEEGIYKSDGINREIDIYEFGSQEKLVRVLVHEFGHALGIEHVDDPKAIMYKLNEGSNVTINDSDLSALRAVCKIK